LELSHLQKKKGAGTSGAQSSDMRKTGMTSARKNHYCKNFGRGHIGTFSLNLKFGATSAPSKGVVEEE